MKVTARTVAGLIPVRPILAGCLLLAAVACNGPGAAGPSWRPVDDGSCPAPAAGSRRIAVDIRAIEFREPRKSLQDTSCESSDDFRAMQPLALVCQEGVWTTARKGREVGVRCKVHVIGTNPQSAVVEAVPVFEGTRVEACPTVQADGSILVKLKLDWQKIERTERSEVKVDLEVGDKTVSRTYPTERAVMAERHLETVATITGGKSAILGGLVRNSTGEAGASKSDHRSTWAFTATARVVGQGP